jgi:hypothetical protein
MRVCAGLSGGATAPPGLFSVGGLKARLYIAKQNSPRYAVLR